TAWSVQAGDEALLDRIEAGREDDRNRRCCRLGHRGSRNGAYGNHRHLTTNQIGRECGQSIIVTLCPAILDRNVLAFDVAGFLQTLAKGGHVTRVSLWRCAVEEPDHRHRRLLRACRERPRRRSAAEQRDELASSHRDDPKSKDRAEYSKSQAVHRSKSGPSLSALGHQRPVDTAAAVAPCPLRPKSGQASACLRLSAKCQKRHYAVQQNCSL